MFRPVIQISALRDIGWTLWDPIGLAGSDGAWPTNCADEYDRYLIKAANLCCDGYLLSQVAQYLDHVAKDQMGLDTYNYEAASRTASAIAEYVDSLR